jgi:hypothetical protein
VEELARLSLLLGVIAIMACGLIAPFAISNANEAKRLAARYRLPPPAYATGGLVLGWLSLTGLFIGLAYAAFVFSVFVG